MVVDDFVLRVVGGENGLTVGLPECGLQLTQEIDQPLGLTR